MAVLQFPSDGRKHLLASAQPQELKVNPASLYLSGLEERTAYRVRGQLDRIADLLAPGTDTVTCPWASVTPEAAAHVKAALALKFPDSRATANTYLACFKGVLRKTFLLGQMDARTWEACKEALSAFRAQPIPAGRALSNEELHQFLASVGRDTSNIGRRDYAMFALYAATGARLDEIRRANLVDLSLLDMTLTITRGKFSKGRVVQLAPWVSKPLSDWLAVRGMEPGALFVAIRHGGKPDRRYRHMSDSGIQAVLARRIKESGVQHFSMHDFRRTRGTQGVKDGRVKETQALLGHADAAQTLAYVRYDEGHQREFVDSIPNPLE